MVVVEKERRERERRRRRGGTFESFVLMLMMESSGVTSSPNVLLVSVFTLMCIGGAELVQFDSDQRSLFDSIRFHVSDF